MGLIFNTFLPFIILLVIDGSGKNNNYVHFSLLDAKCKWPMFTVSLHKNLDYYETLHSSHFEHKVVKRGTEHSKHPYNKINEVEFHSHGR